MVTVRPQLIKYSGYLGAALICWLLPTGANLPPLFGIICLITAIAAFVYAAIEGRELAKVLAKARIRTRAAEEIDNHTLATRTHYAMEAITREAEIEFAPSPRAYAYSATAALPPAKETQIDEETQAYIDMLVSLSKDIGWLTPTTVTRRRKKFRDFTPDQIRAFFQELASFGIGETQGEGDKLEWKWSTERGGK